MYKHGPEEHQKTGTMQNPYIIIVLASLVIICSYIFTRISRFTKIPSVIFLIGTGIAIQFGIKSMGIVIPNLSQYISLLGIVGLMMIVLEGALDIKISRSKVRMVLAALATSMLILAITNTLIALVLFSTLNIEFLNAFFFAIPLSVVSSAIVIPSVHALVPVKKEFMILEATLSDIFGIMLFEFWIIQPEIGQSHFEAISLNVIISFVASLVMSYVLVYLFHKIVTGIKFFLFLAILALLFAVGEYFHYSALLIILIFGLVLNNTQSFFQGPLKRIINEVHVAAIRHEFVIITNETSFLIRTFFFIAFGLTMNLNGLFDITAISISLFVMLVIYLTRALNLKVFIRSNIFPQLFIAPRGLVTILLFHKVVAHEGVEPFSQAVLAWVIIGTNLIMMGGLIASGNETEDILTISVGDPGATTLDYQPEDSTGQEDTQSREYPLL